MDISNLQLKKNHETKLAGYEARFQFAQKSVERHLSTTGTRETPDCKGTFRLWLLCRWPDSFVLENGALEGGVGALRIPCPATRESSEAPVSFTLPMPMLVGKHGMEISSARAFLERTDVQKYDEYTALTDYAMGVYHAQIEMCADWTLATKMGLHELQTCILEAADLIHQLATPTLRSWHKGKKDDKHFTQAMYKEWAETTAGIGKHVFGNGGPEAVLQPHRAVGQQPAGSAAGSAGAAAAPEDDLVSLFVTVFSPPKGDMWDLWTWLNTLKEQQDNPALDLVKLRAPMRWLNHSDSSSSSKDSEEEEDD